MSAGNTTYNYTLTSGDITINDTGGTDLIQVVAGIDFATTAIIKYGDDLIIDMDGHGTITIEDHFITNNRIERLLFQDGADADFDADLDLNLTASNLVLTERNPISSNAHFIGHHGTSADEILFYGAGSVVADDTSYPTGYSNGTSFKAKEGDDFIIANFAGEVNAGKGDDVVYGHAGVIFLAEGDDVFYSRENDDFYGGFGVYGGDGNDAMFGTDDDDFFHGDRGNYHNVYYDGGEPISDIVNPGDDILYGYGGNDGLYGYEGNDELYGGDGVDTLNGGAGHDYLDAGDGGGHAVGGAGIDTIIGGDGQDIISTGSDLNLVYTEYEEVWAGAGDDIIQGSKNNDRLRGELGDDFIWSNNGGSDFLYGGSGNDYIKGRANVGEMVTMYGGSGTDHLRMLIGGGDLLSYGGFGNDTYVYYPSSIGADIGNNILEDEFGLDDALYFRINTDIYSLLNFSVSGDDLVITIDGRTGSITINDQFVIDKSIEKIQSGSFNDDWFAQTFEKTIDYEYALVETLTEFDDTYTATSLTSVIGSDRNIVDALDGDDVVHLGAGDDLVYGRGGDDILYGEAGDDVLSGGTGGDTLDGGSDNDTAAYIDSADAVNIDLLNNVYSGGDAAGDTLISIENIIGSENGSNRDPIYGDNNANAIDGLGGDDILEGGGGADTIDGGLGWDYARYTRSASGVTVNLETNVNTGGDAAGDLLYNIEAVVGSAHDDTITGGLSNDYIKGENGDDILSGGLGSDQLYGGEGNDSFIFTGGLDRFFEQGSGTDTVIFDAAWSPDDLVINGNVFLFEAFQNQITFDDVSLYEVFRFDGFADMSLVQLQAYIDALGVTYTGDAGDNTFIGTSATETFEGLGGSDTVDYSASTIGNNVDLQGGAGTTGFAGGDTYVSIENVIGSDTASERDWIWGDAQDNNIQGLAGADILEGGAGADTIDGGAGWDYSRYLRSDAGVNINLESGVNTGGHAEGDVLSNIEAIVGSSHNDTIRGGNSNDYLKGENGDDTIAGGSGVDQLYGGNGADTFLFDGATAFNNVDQIRDFDLSENDMIDIADLLVGYDALTDAITDFVQITDNGTDSTLAVDADGGADNFVSVATIYGAVGLTDEDALEAGGNLVGV